MHASTCDVLNICSHASARVMYVCVEVDPHSYESEFIYIYIFGHTYIYMLIQSYKCISCTSACLYEHIYVYACFCILSMYDSYGCMYV